jgi:hypothetical protein
MNKYVNVQMLRIRSGAVHAQNFLEEAILREAVAGAAAAKAAPAAPAAAHADEAAGGLAAAAAIAGALAGAAAVGEEAPPEGKDGLDPRLQAAAAPPPSPLAGSRTGSATAAASIPECISE